MDKEERFNKNINELISEDNFDRTFLNSIGKLAPSPRRLAFLIMVFMVFEYFLCITEAFNETLKLGLSIILPVIATLATMIFAGYALFQTLSSKETLILLLKNDSGKVSVFLDMNREFFILFVSYIALLVIGVVVYICLVSVPNDWELKIFPTSINTLIASTLMALYFMFVCHCIVELKSFIYDLYQCFKISVICKIFDN